MKKTIAIAFVSLFISSYAAAQQVEWNYNGKAVAKGQITQLGQGCDSEQGDTSFVVAGNEISVVFTNMNVELNDPYLPLSGRKNCKVVIPTRIAKGMYLGRLDQKLTYAINKTSGSMGTIRSSARFFDFSLGSIVINAQPSEVGMINSTKSASNDFMMKAPSWCKTYKDKAFMGNLTLDMVVNGMRSHNSQVIGLFIDGYDARWTAVGGIYSCNL